MMHWQGLTELTAPRTRRSAWSTPTRPACRCAPTRRTRPCKDLLDAIKANPGKYKASGTGQGGIWHLAIAGMLQRPEDRSGRRALGAQQRRGARPAGHGRGRRRDRAVLAARGAVADRRRQGQEPGGHERQARPRFTRTCRRSRRRPAATGRWRPGAASRRPRACPADVRDKLVGGAARRSRQQGVHRLHGQPRLRRHLRRPGRASASTWPSRDADLGATMKAVGHRQVARPPTIARRQGRRLQAQRRRSGVVLLAAGGAVLCRRPGVPDDPGPARRPGAVSRADRRRPVRLPALLLIVRGLRAARRRALARRRRTGCARRATWSRFVVLRRRPGLLHPRRRTGWASCSPRR